MVTARDAGQLVRDSTGRVGILRDVIRDYEDSTEAPSERCKRPTAFVWPEGGGREWLAPPDAVTRV